MGLIHGLLTTEAWSKAFHAGILDALRIAEQTRLDLKIDRGVIEGVAASRYLLEVLDRQGRHAEKEAAKGYGRHRWLWYLRSLPDAIFDGHVDTISPLNRGLAEVIATRGAGPEKALGVPAEDGSFPFDGASAKRIAWVCGFAWGVALAQTQFRVVGKGGKLIFDERRPGIAFPLARVVDDGQLMKQLLTFDARNGSRRLFTRLGVPVDEFRPANPDWNFHFFLLEKVIGIHGTALATDPGPHLPQALSTRFRPNLMPGRQVIEMLSDRHVHGAITWSPDVPSLIAMLSLVAYLSATDSVAHMQMQQRGFILVDRDEFDALLEKRRSEGADLMKVLDLFPDLTPGVPLSDRLLEIEGTLTPYRPGPVAFKAEGRTLGLDPYNATQRLVTLLEFPKVSGDSVRVRGDAFEAKVQETIDKSPWAPPPEVKKLVGRHFKVDGKRLGEVDAFGARDGTLLLVSCKSFIYNLEYDQGVHSEIRNVQSKLKESIEQFERLEAYFTEFPAKSGEYDLSAYDRICIVVVTPQPMYVTEPLLSQMALPGLRTCSGFEEFRDWLREADGAGDLDG